MMKVLIIEDEELAAERLEKVLVEIEPGITVLAKLGSIKDSVKWLMQNSADLIFLDIQLSDGISFSIFEQVSIHTPIIFTTAYDEYALKAFQLNSISYLLKPIRKTDLLKSIQKYKTIKSTLNIDFEQLLSSIQNKKPEFRKRFLIQIGEKFRKIEIIEIAYFYASDKNVFFKTFEGKSYPIDFSLDNLENVIDPALFFRINRRYIVNLNSITSMNAWSRSRIKIELKPPVADETDIIVSIDRASEFKNWMNN